MKKVFIVFLSFLNFIIIQSQIRSLNLEECIKLAGDSSLQMFKAKNLYLESYWEYQTYKAERLPSLNLKVTPIQYHSDFTKRYDLQNDVDVYRRQQSLYSSGNLAINQNIDWTGGTFFIDSELGYIKNIGLNSYSQFSSIPIRIGFYQPLFGFNKFKWQKKIEPLKYEKAQKELLYNLEEISEMVIDYFFDFALAQVQLSIAKENVASSDTLFRYAEERYKIKGISESELLMLKLDLINAENTLENTENNFKKSMFNLIVFLSLDKNTNIELVIPEIPKNVIIPIDFAIEYYNKNNPSCLSYNKEILASKRELEKNIKNSLFDASISLSIGLNQISNKLKNVYNNPLQQEIISMGLTVPLIDWGIRKGRINVARNNLDIAQLSAEQNKVKLEQEIIMIINEFNIQQRIISKSEESMNLAINIYNNTKQRYIFGKTDINTLTLSFNRQKEAQIDYISTLKKYWLSYYRIRKLTLFDFKSNKSISYLFETCIKV